MYEPQIHPLGIAYAWLEKGVRFDWEGRLKEALLGERVRGPGSSRETQVLLENTLTLSFVGGGVVVISLTKCCSV